jgi:hypothetical protein
MREVMECQHSGTSSLRRGLAVTGSRAVTGVSRLPGLAVTGSRGYWVAGLLSYRVNFSTCPRSTSDPASPYPLAAWQPRRPRDLATPQPRDPATQQPSNQQQSNTTCICERPSPYYVSHLSCDDLSKASRRAFQRMVFSALIVGFRPDSKVSNTQGCFMNSYDAR